MNDDLISAHMFLYYEDMSIEVLKRLNQFYGGHIYLSLVEGNKYNEEILLYAKKLFDTKVIYVPNRGSDQYGFYHSFKADKTNKEWVLYLHDKHPDKKEWLFNLIDDISKTTNKFLKQKNIGIISSDKHKQQAKSLNEILTLYGNIEFKYRKGVVQSMHTILWVKELQRILLEKHELICEEHLYPHFSAGNIFIANRKVIDVSHSCVYEEFFNDNYRTDGEVAHGLERFYFYVSKCLGYNNIFI
jgi:lipopolysaccharide biosynthesis protein